MKHLLVFLAMVATDYFWGRYTVSATKHRAMPAALWSAGIVLLGSFVTVEYINDTSLLYAAVAGAFVGTYWSVLHESTKEGSPAANL